MQKNVMVEHAPIPLCLQQEQHRSLQLQWNQARVLFRDTFGGLSTKVVTQVAKDPEPFVTPFIRHWQAQVGVTSCRVESGLDSNVELCDETGPKISLLCFCFAESLGQEPFRRATPGTLFASLVCARSQSTSTSTNDDLLSDKIVDRRETGHGCNIMVH